MAALGAVGVNVFDASSTYSIAGRLPVKVDYGPVAIGSDEPFPVILSGWGWFGLGIEGLFSAVAAEKIDWVNDTIKCAILNTQPNRDTAQFWADISAHEVSGTGYSAGGVALTSKALAYDSTTRRVKLEANDAGWSTVTFTGGTWAVIYKDTGSPSSSPLMAALDLGGVFSPSSQDFAVDFAGGIVLYALI